MKKHISVLVCLQLFLLPDSFSQTGKPVAFKINLNLSGLKVGDTVTLASRNRGTGAIENIVQSVTTSSKEVLNGAVKEEGIYTILVKGKGAGLYVDGTPIYITGHADSVHVLAVKGSKLTEAYSEVLRAISCCPSLYKELALKHNALPAGALALRAGVRRFTEEERWEVWNNFTTEVKESKEGQATAKVLEGMSSTAIGKQLPEVAAVTFKNEAVSLSVEIQKGELTIIDFWASWCLPCRKQIPDLLALYNNYKHKGLNVIGISMDNDKAKWNKAVADDKTNWLHISDLKAFEKNSIAQKFGLSGIPQYFLVDRKGIIVDKNNSVSALKESIDKYFSSNND